MKKSVIYFGSVISVILLLTSSISITANETTEPEEPQYSVDLEEVKNKLSELGLSFDNTFVEYKQAIYDWVYNELKGSPECLEMQLNDLDLVFDDLEKTGIKPDMMLGETLSMPWLFFGSILVYCRMNTPFGYFTRGGEEITCRNSITSRTKHTGLFGHCMFRGVLNLMDYEVYATAYSQYPSYVNDLFIFAYVVVSIG